MEPESITMEPKNTTKKVVFIVLWVLGAALITLLVLFFTWHLSFAKNLIFGKKLTFNEAYNKVLFSDVFKTDAEEVDLTKPVRQKTDFSTNIKYEDVFSVSVLFGSEWTADLNSGNVDWSIFLDLKGDIPLSISNSILWGISNSSLDSTDFPSDGIASPKNPQENLKRNIDVSLSGKVQLNESWLYGLLENIHIHMNPSEIYNTESLTKVLGAATNQWVSLLAFDSWYDEDEFRSGFSVSLNKDAITSMANEKTKELSASLDRIVRTYPLLQEVEETKVDGDLAYKFAWNPEGVSGVVNELVQLVDVSDLGMYAMFLPTEISDLLEHKDEMASLFVAGILRNPISWYIIVKDKDDIELRVDSFQWWEAAKLAGSFSTKGVWKIQAMMSWEILFTIDFSKTESVFLLDMVSVPTDMAVKLQIDKSGKTTIALSVMWATMDIATQTQTRNIPSYEPTIIENSKTLGEISEAMNVLSNSLVGDDALLSKEVRNRAIATQHKSNLGQIGAAMAIYKMDGNYPVVSGYDLAAVERFLVPAYMSHLPEDDSDYKRQHFDGKMSTWYIYIPIRRNWMSNQAVLLMAWVEWTSDANGSLANWIDQDNMIVSMEDPTILDFNKVEKAICKKITITGTTEDDLFKCTAKKNSTALRYVYIQ